ncbi:MAG: hypothetical protein HY567_04725 [Candidatus Kerfeldbacteria bacterium]|nr:hypothetical protein [Candidatus Kerfeldbacteria bacterium]
MFLKKDLDALRGKVTELEGKVRKAGRDMAGSIADDPNVWHDNPAYDEAQREQGMWNGELERYRKMLRESQEVPVEAAPDTVGIGRTAIVMNMTESGKLYKYLIGSFMVLVPTEGLASDVQEVSYGSPIGRILMGAKGGDFRKGVVTGKEVTFFIARAE